jgi:hypothetical protein
MYIFDTLIYNPGRPPASTLYNLENWQLVLAGHDDTFGTRKGRPRYLSKVTLDLSNEWRKKLSALDEASLTETLDGALDKRRIAALVKRRDELLDNN